MLFAISEPPHALDVEEGPLAFSGLGVNVGLRIGLLQ